MKHFKVLCSSLIMAALVVFTSCRVEDSEFITPSTEETIEANSEVAKLMQEVAFANDSVNKDSYAKLKCLKVKLPVTVIVKGEDKVIASKKEFCHLKKLFKFKKVVFKFPIVLLKKDAEDIIVKNQETLDGLLKDCKGYDNTNDDDSDDDDSDDDKQKCVSFEYPIKASIYNKKNDVVKTFFIKSDKQMFKFISDIKKHHVVKLHFPITVLLSDGSKKVAENRQELKDIIKAAKADCKDNDNDDDKDDDNGGKKCKNILVLTSCYTYTLPITVEIDGTKKVIETQKEFYMLKKVKGDKLSLEFPVTVIRKGTTDEIVVNSLEELKVLAKNCSEGKDDDKDDDKGDDNIIERASCVRYQLPFTVFVDGEQKIIDSKKAFYMLKKVDNDKLVVEFPITVFKKNEEIVVASLEELEAIAEFCSKKGDDDNDDDKDDDKGCKKNIFVKTSCYNYELPITVSIKGKQKVIDSKKAFHMLKKINDKDLEIQFPLTVVKKGTSEAITVNTMEELKELAKQCSK